SLFLASYSLFGPTTPHWLIFAALLAGGFFRSLQFTSVNTLSFADVPPGLMSRATSFASMAQQLSISIGVGTGALFLHLTLLLHDRTILAAGDFGPAFAGVALVSLLSLLFFLPLSRDAGAEVSGHRYGTVPPSAT
ncbi:MAG TPA: MFS transporter, partial [Methyloceanibacter sp.]|nr:MFS transporter [Methyloceanibacter sp.]